MDDLTKHKTQKNIELTDEVNDLSELNILVTEADKTGTDITKMSNFMGLYVQQLTNTLAENSFSEKVLSIPISDIGIINDIIQQGLVSVNDNITLVPDFDNLPSVIKKKLKKGIYSIGNSKQVEGNLRPVIIDEKGVRVKDITLKQVINNSTTFDATQSILNQIQMKQIYDTLKSIQEIQDYQMDCDRDRDLIIPFLDARDYILRAQNAKTNEERIKNLEKASDKLATALNGVYKNMDTTSSHLARKTKWLPLQRQSTINKFLSYLSYDLQLATTFCGVQMHVFEALGERQNSKQVFDNYRAVMHRFLTEKIENSGLSAIELMHDNYKYTKENMDCWYNFSKELEPALEKAQQGFENKQIYILSVEDIENDKGK